MNLGRLDQHLGGGTFWGLLAEALVSWADIIDDHFRLLDERNPD
jgi:hypothetical protein